MNWFDKNFILVYHEKTNLMCFRNPHKQATLTIHISIDYLGIKYPTKQPFVKTTIYLGLFLNENSTWATHVDYVAKRLKAVSSYIYLLGNAGMMALKVYIYQTLGESILLYGLADYGFFSNSNE